MTVKIMRQHSSQRQRWVVKVRGYVAHPIRQGNAIVLQSQDCLSMRNDKNQPTFWLDYTGLL